MFLYTRQLKKKYSNKNPIHNSASENQVLKINLIKVDKTKKTSSIK